jgi:hypothetical protein
MSSSSSLQSVSFPLNRAVNDDGDVITPQIPPPQLTRRIASETSFFLAVSTHRNYQN